MKFSMTWLAVFFGLFLVSPLANVAQAQDLNFQEYRKFLMSGDPANKKMAIQTTCTNEEGEVFRIGQAGYNECLNTAQKALKEKQAEGQKSETLSSNTASTGLTIHIGEE